MLPGFQLVPTHRSEAEPRVQILILGAPEDHWHCRCAGEEHSRHVFMDIHMYYIVTYKQMNVYNYINYIYICIHTHTLFDIPWSIRIAPC
jgi:hypothetical protein